MKNGALGTGASAASSLVGHPIRALILVGLIAATGCSTARPNWVAGSIGNEGYQYQYISGAGEGPTLVRARRAAVIDAVSQAAQSGDVELRESGAIRTLGTNINSVADIEDIIDTSTRIEGAPVTIRGWELYDSFVETQTDGSGYEAHVLYRFERGSDARPPPSRLVWVAKSAVLPGWGQRARGAKGRGNTFMSSFLGGAAFVGFLDWKRGKQIDRYNQAGTQPEKDDARNKANGYAHTRNGVLSAVVAIWSFSMVDAISGDSQLLPFRVHGSATGGSVSFSLRVPF